MRLSHIGFEAYMIGDTTLPRVGHGDLVLVNSSSGNTPSILLYTEQAKQAGATIISLSANNESKIASLADRTICYTVEEDFQLMKTSYEQFSFLFWDFVAQKIIVSGNLNVEKIEYNHSILE
jgi:6-phospho-3-hexuloisomerase